MTIGRMTRFSQDLIYDTSRLRLSKILLYADENPTASKHDNGLRKEPTEENKRERDREKETLLFSVKWEKDTRGQ